MFPQDKMSSSLRAPPTCDRQGIRTLMSAASISDTAAVQNQSQRSTSIDSPSPGSSVRGVRSHKQPRAQRVRNPARKPRAPRPVYTQEQDDAISYFRDSVQLSWKRVVRSWNQLYPNGSESWTRRSVSGLQSRYYRAEPRTDGVRRSSAPDPEIGLLRATTRRYWWTYGTSPSVMETLGNHTAEELKQLAKRHASRVRRQANTIRHGQKRTVKRSAKRSAHHSSSLRQSFNVIDEDEELEMSTTASSCHSDDDSAYSSNDSMDASTIRVSDLSESLSADTKLHSSDTSPPPTSPRSDVSVSRHSPNVVVLPSFQAINELADLGNPNNTRLLTSREAEAIWWNSNRTMYTIPKSDKMALDSLLGP